MNPDPVLRYAVRRRLAWTTFLNLIFGPVMVNVLMFGDGALQQLVYWMLLLSGPACFVAFHRIDRRIVTLLRRCWGRELELACNDDAPAPAPVTPPASPEPSATARLASAD